MLPLVTIITPTYNRASFLDETIQSVLLQDYPNIEYIVLDDGSTDNTLDVLKKYKNKIEWLSHNNIGEQRTVNKGVSLAKGEFVCIVNSDDPIYQGLISKSVNKLLEDETAIATYPDWNEIDVYSNIIRQIRLPDYNIVNMLTSLSVSMGPGLVFRKKYFSHKPIRDVSLRFAGDLDFYFRLAHQGTLIHIPEVLATHRTHADSLSATQKSRVLANEIVYVINRALNYPNLPDEIHKQRYLILSRINRIAIHHSGKDTIAKIYFLLRSLFYLILHLMIR